MSKAECEWEAEKMIPKKEGIRKKWTSKEN